MNTIYDNTFVLGQTSATNFVAGLGIKIDEPSEGVVRIGTDETVLWSGTSHTGSLTESVENFDTIKINYITDDNMQGVSEFIPAYGKNITLDSMYVASNSAVWIKATNYTFSANTSFASYPYQMYVSNNKITATWYNNTANASFRLTRVIGINRISGSNA